jgi:hypothetical protein
MDPKKRMEDLVNQYNDCMSKKQQFHDLAQQCLGAIEVLKKIEEDKECQDSDEKVKKG